MIAENLLSYVHSSMCMNVINLVPLPDFTISRSEVVSFHAECELIKHIKKTLQVEEFCDIDSLSVLLTFLKCTYIKLKNKCLWANLCLLILLENLVSS
jgi:hypothetical protein